MSTSNIDNGSIKSINTMPRSGMESNQNSGTALESNPQTEFDMASKRDAQAIPGQDTETRKTPEPSTNVEPTATTESESPPDDINTDSHNQPSVKDITKANVILSNFKTDVQAQDLIINIEGPAKHAGDIKEDKDFLVYEYFGQHIRPPRTTWVFYEGGGGGTPMDESTRNEYARKVFLLLLIMLLITGAFTVIVFTVDSLNDFFKEFGFPIFLTSALVLIALCYAISCLACSRQFPGNVILLTLAVIAMSCMCSYACVRHSSHIVFMALIATAALVVVCFLLALSSFDFTRFYLYIVLLSVAVCALGLVFLVARFAFGFYMKPLHLAIVIAATIIQTIMLAMEIQMVLGGRAIELGEEEVTLGAFLLYTSVVQLFLNCLQIMGLSFEDFF